MTHVVNAHLVGQLILAAMLYISARIMAVDIWRNAGRIWRAFAANFRQPDAPRTTTKTEPKHG